MKAAELEAAGQSAYTVEFRGGTREVYGDGTPLFTFVVADRRQWDHVLNADAYSAALGFVRGEFEIRGDLIAAIALKTRSAGGLKSRLYALLYALRARFAPRRLETWLQGRARAADNIRFHYDRSNEFYQLFLDSHMQYSSAYFKGPSWTLEEAQIAKLDLICRKLALRPGDRFLDIGCGWGGLVMHAAERYGVAATGCTLSRRQFEYAEHASTNSGLRAKVTIHEMDYRELDGKFDKIASIGMFEHVGRHRLREYFTKIRFLLEDGGLFLNSGIVRPQFVKDGAETLFLQRKVFPGGELAHLADITHDAESSGLEILQIDDMRFHYALTCREWVGRLQQNEEGCLRLVDRQTYRTWLLYLAASALSFEQGASGDYQILMGKRRSYPARPLGHEYGFAA